MDRSNVVFKTMLVPNVLVLTRLEQAWFSRFKRGLNFRVGFVPFATSAAVSFYNKGKAHVRTSNTS